MLASLTTLAVAAVTGCDPCFGVSACNVSARFAVQGRLLDDSTGRPVRGAAIDFVRTGGIATERDSARVLTNDEGLFHFDMNAQGVGEVGGDIVVRLPNGGGYRSPGMRFPASTRRGEGKLLPPWSTTPRLPDLAVVYRRGTPFEALADVVVEFRQTGGPLVSGIQNGLYTDTTDASGMFYLFANQVQPLDGGDVVGDLTVKLPPPLDAVHRDMHIPVQTVFKPASRLHLVGVGPNLEYHIEVRNRGTGEVVPGVRVDFERTGGIAVEPPTWSQVTERSGRVVFPVRALAPGTLTGNVTIAPSPPFKTYQKTGLQFPTYDEDGARLFMAVGIGPGLPYYAIIRNGATPLRGVQVDFLHRGGIAVNPAAFSRFTNDSGMVFLFTAPASEGDVIADIRVHSPAPFPGFLLRNVKLTALEADPPGGRILLGDWNVAVPPTGSEPIP